MSLKESIRASRRERSRFCQQLGLNSYILDRNQRIVRTALITAVDFVRIEILIRLFAEKVATICV
jgi:hypothetical protein